MKSRDETNEALKYANLGRKQVSIMFNLLFRTLLLIRNIFQMLGNIVSKLVSFSIYDFQSYDKRTTMDQYCIKLL